ncbi:MAG: 3'(2'),5'-bisphosphate nucleotidase CysQ [Actinomycetota bacterium]|nr:3'(2'),5'-bisphosphate nucleotidase CysQ [Actinomycetota bacterium]
MLALRAEMGFGDPAALKGAGDRRAQDVLAAALARARPHDAVLSEEALDDPARLAASRVWIIDPLDGTREFSEHGRTDWAVHVALWQNGSLAAGAVALPALGVTLSSAAAGGPTSDQSRPLRVAVSRTRAPAIAAEVAGHLSAELVPMGSCGAKVAAVVLGQVDAYVHAGGQYEWDSAAPVAVAMAAGLHASRLDGSALVYNQPDPYLPDLLVCLPHLASRILELTVAAAGTSREQT